MAQLLKDSQVGAAIEELIDKADEFLWLVSPYIRLHEKIKDKLKTAARRNPLLQIVVIFGKNEDDVSKSIRKEDLEFLKSLPDIQIGYEPRLHAKFYASEDCCIISSMNLYEFSHNTNIEIGIKLEGKKWLKSLNGASGIEQETLIHFSDLIDNSKPVFIKEAMGKSAMFGLTSAYSHSEIIQDNTDSFFRIKEFTARPTYKRKQLANLSQPKMGYCIRTGVAIPFDTKRPFSAEGFKAWNQYKRPDYPEKYCHFSGEPSHGQNSFSKPILSKNFRQAQEAQR